MKSAYAASCSTIQRHHRYNWQQGLPVRQAKMVYRSARGSRAGCIYVPHGTYGTCGTYGTHGTYVTAVGLSFKS